MTLLVLLSFPSCLPHLSQLSISFSSFPSCDDDLEKAKLGFTYMSWFSSGVCFPRSSVISSQKHQLKYKPSYFVGTCLLGLVGC